MEYLFFDHHSMWIFTQKVVSYLLAILIPTMLAILGANNNRHQL